MSPTLAGLSQAPTIKLQPHSSAEHKPKDVPPFLPPPTPQPHQPCPGQTGSLQSPPASLQWGGPAHTQPPCKASWGRATQGKDKGKIVFPCTLLHLSLLLSSLLPLSFSSSSSCLRTAACLINDDIGAFPLLLYSIIFVLVLTFTLVESLYVQSICNYLWLISPKSSAREAGMSALAAPLSRWTSQYREDKSQQQQHWHLSIHREVFWSGQPRSRSPRHTVPFR